MRFCLVAITNYRSIKPYFSILKRVVGYYYYLLKIEYATNQLNYLSLVIIMILIESYRVADNINNNTNN